MQQESENNDRKAPKDANQFRFFYDQQSEESEEEKEDDDVDSQDSFDYPGKKKKKHNLDDKRGLYITQINKERYSKNSRLELSPSKSPTRKREGRPPSSNRKSKDFIIKARSSASSFKDV